MHPVSDHDPDPETLHEILAWKETRKSSLILFQHKNTVCVRTLLFTRSYPCLGDSSYSYPEFRTQRMTNTINLPFSVPKGDSSVFLVRFDFVDMEPHELYLTNRDVMILQEKYRLFLHENLAALRQCSMMVLEMANPALQKDVMTVLSVDYVVRFVHVLLHEEEFPPILFHGPWNVDAGDLRRMIPFSLDRHKNVFLFFEGNSYVVEDSGEESVKKKGRGIQNPPPVLLMEDAAVRQCRFMEFNQENMGWREEKHTRRQGNTLGFFLVRQDGQCRVYQDEYIKLEEFEDMELEVKKLQFHLDHSHTLVFDHMFSSRDFLPLLSDLVVGERGCRDPGQLSHLQFFDLPDMKPERMEQHMEQCFPIFRNVHTVSFSSHVAENSEKLKKIMEICDRQLPSLCRYIFENCAPVPCSTPHDTIFLRGNRSIHSSRGRKMYRSSLLFDSFLNFVV